MNLHHLLVFHVTARTGSITACSRELHVSQPALSRELKVFQERLRVDLFERVPRGMRLTAAGEVLAAYAERLFGIADAAEAAMSELADGNAGHLSIAASNTIGTYVLPAYLAEFRRDNPTVTVSVFVGNTAQVAEAVADMRYPIGFIEGPLHVVGLSATALRDDVVRPVVTAAHPLAAREGVLPFEVSDHPLLMREQGSGTRELISGVLRALSITQGPIMEFGNTEAIKQACIHGGGIAWLPEIAIEDELRQGRLMRLRCEALAITRRFSLIRRQGAPSLPAEQRFLALLQ
jgi:DNA-binding transcriptional LysR family regulator